MAYPQTYTHFIDLLLEKVAYTFITVKTVEKLGSCFWPLLDESFKNLLKMEKRRNAFWYFAQYLKRCINSRNFHALFHIWDYLSPEAKNMWENINMNKIKGKVDRLI